MKPFDDGLRCEQLSCSLKDAVFGRGPEDDVAIIGLSCRLPAANNADEFWQHLVEGEDATKPLPPDRHFTKNDLTDSVLDRPAGYLKCPIDEFDRRFFEISPREAELMDPQQRLLLEISWESLENAGVNPLTLNGSNTAVFVGMWAQEYAMFLANAAGKISDFQHKYLGNAFCASSARISHFLGLRGPSVTMEAGCASALEAVHYACDSLLKRETNLAISCGVNIILRSSGDTEALDAFILSKVGKCKTFDESADGFARAEACGSLVLKRLSDARAAGDRILGIIRGSAVNHDGSGSSLGTPNGVAQSIAISKALNMAGVSPAEISYVECHGTGTPIGDPIEVAALNSVFGGTQRMEPLIIGSVKTNIGHTEGASGIAGLIRVLLCMKHRIIPKHLHLKTLNPNINLEVIPAVIPLENMQWEESSKHGLLAGVSSFGLSGTNVHMVLQEPPLSATEMGAPPSEITVERPYHILTVSAKSDKALQDLTAAYISKLEREPDLGLGDLCFSANTTRAHFRNRACVIAKDLPQLLNRLKKGQFVSNKVKNVDRKVAFLFTGQGSQYAEMGRQLYLSSPVFKEHFDLCNSVLKNNYHVNLVEILSYEMVDGFCENSLDESSLFSQTSLFCIEYCLFKLWESFGIQPDFVLGHSVGEFAAAVCAGILSLEDALKLVVGRGKLVNQLREGRMLAVRASQVDKLLNDFNKSARESDFIDIAAVNSAEETVVSGLVQAVGRFQAFCSERNVKTQILAAKHAFHSREMDQILDQYRRIVETVEINKELKGKVRFFSSSHGKELDAGQVDNEYWLHHLRGTVRFSSALDSLLKVNGSSVLIEVGPQPVLLALCANSASAETQHLLLCPSIRKSEENWLTILTSLSKLYANGIDVDWVQFDAPYQRNRLDLPNYPFQRERFWLKSERSSASLVINSRSVHPFLGKRLPHPITTDFQYVSSLSLETLPFIRDHKVLDRTIIPAASFIEAFLAAGREILCCGSSKCFVPLVIENFMIEAAVALLEDESVQMQMILKPQKTDENSDLMSYDAELYRQTAFDKGGSDAGKWRKVASARFLPSCLVETTQQIDLDQLKGQLKVQGNAEIIYSKLNAAGIAFGPLFQSCKATWYSENEILVRAELPEGSDQFVVHPIVLDAMIQVAGSVRAIEMSSKGVEANKLYLPMLVGSCISLQRTFSSELYIYMGRNDPSNSTNVLKLYDSNGVELASMSAIDFVDTRRENFLRLLDLDTLVYPSFYEEVWQATLAPSAKRHDWTSVLTVDKQEIRDSVKDSLHATFVRHEYLCDNLEGICYQFILKGFQDIGWYPAIGNMVSPCDFIERHNVCPKYLKVIGRWLQILCEEGVVELIDRSDIEIRYKVMQPIPDASEIEANISQLLAIVGEEYETESRFICLLGERLSDILQGKVSPMMILFSESRDGVEVDAFYQSETKQLFHRVVASVNTRILEAGLLKSIKKNGEDERPDFVLKVLEVGGGLGSATVSMIQSFEQLNISYEYIFTDISPLFLQKASEKFAANRNMKYALLDIEKDPLSQGFAPNYFDCVIADNVLHATRSLEESVRNIRTLLVPGGEFLLFEQGRPFKVMDISFTFMDDWWRFEDFHLRPDYPTISTEKWQSVLSNNGFSEVLCCEHGNAPFGGCIGFTQNGECIPISLSPSSRGTWILCKVEGRDFCKELSMKLESLSYECVVVERRTGVVGLTEVNSRLFEVDPFDSENFAMLLNSLKDRNMKGVLYMSNLEQSSSQSSNHGDVAGLLNIMKAIIGIGHSPAVDLILVTMGAFGVPKDWSCVNPSNAPLWGMLLAFKNEYQAHRAIAVDLEHDKSAEFWANDVFHQLFLINEKEHQIAFRNGTKFVKRLLQVNSGLPSLSLPNTERFCLQNTPTGSFSDFLISSDTKSAIELNQIEVLVDCVALNFKDILFALRGSGTDKNIELNATEEDLKAMESLGLDFSGAVSAVGNQVVEFKVGDPVYGMTSEGAFKSHVVVDKSLAWKVPHGLSFEEVSTLPVAFLTAHYFLVDMGRLTVGDKLLVHTASGGVGLAAIQIANEIGCQLFVTAGSKRKRQYLRSLGLKHVYNSRSTDYAKQIMIDTNGVGVNIVLNSLTGPNFKESTLSVCAQNARFLEMSKLNVWTKEEVKELRPDVFYFIQDVRNLSRDGTLLGGILGTRDQIEENLNKLSQNLFNKVYRPLPLSKFVLTRVHDAFKFLQDSKHIGKVVVKMPRSSVSNTKGTCFEEHIFNENSSYLITGGLGGIGMEVAKWMTKSGAKYLVLVGRSPPVTRAEAIICELRKHGVEVLVGQADVADWSQCKAVLEQIRAVGFPPLKGIMHAAGVLSNYLIPEQTLESLDSVLRPKIQGTWNLHNLTDNSEYSLEYFVLFSSFVSVIGGVGQSNHAAANKFLDSFAQFRHSRGLPCTSINWGAWGEIGAASELHTESIGIPRFSSGQGIAALERVLIAQKTNFVASDLNWAIVKQTFNPGLLLEHVTETQITKIDSSAIQKRITGILEAGTDDKLDLIKDFVEDMIRDVLHLPPYESIDRDQDFREMGADSLIAVEMRGRVQQLLADYDIRQVTLVDFQENRTVNKLSKLVLSIMLKGNSTSQSLSEEDLLELVKQDSILPEDILTGLELCSPPVLPSQASKVLLTGVTGTLGPYILHYLLNWKPHLQVYCLIRADSLAKAADRLEKRLCDFDLFDNTDLTNVTCILGDVGKPNLGLTDATYFELAEIVDTVIHSAACTNLVLPYGNFSTEDLRSANVVGLLNILRFCGTTKVKHLQFASTIFAVTSANSDGTMSECFPTDDEFGVESLKVGYFVSKFVCEKLLKQVVGIPLTVLRHNILCGDSKTGIADMKNSSLMMFLLACRKTALIPQMDHDYTFTIIPVDTAADISVQLLSNDNTQEGIYNIVNPKIVKISQLEEMFRKRGYKVKSVPYEEWRCAAVAGQSAELAPLAELFIKDIFNSEMFREHQLIKMVSGDDASKFFKTSDRLKRCIPNVDEIMPDPFELADFCVTYYENTFGKDNFGPLIDAALGNDRKPSP